MSTGYQEAYMRLALEEAALDENEVPVGAVIVRDGQVIARAHNARETTPPDPLGHAELLALRRAAETLGERRLTGCVLYVTLEPCPMCAGAIINARIPHVVFGAREENTGSCGSVIDLFSERYGHRPAVFPGVCEAESRALLQRFFQERRS